MIMLTRFNGPPFALNPDLIERADATPDTVVTLVGGTKYVVAESLDELMQRVRDFRAQVIWAAQMYESEPEPGRTLRVVAESAPDDGPLGLHRSGGV